MKRFTWFLCVSLLTLLMVSKQQIGFNINSTSKLPVQENIRCSPVTPS